MKTQNKTLGFRKNSVVELNSQELFEINGGTSTIPCGAAAVGAAAALVVAAVEVVNDAGVAVGEAISRAID